jgi:hypothetical protein
MYVCVWGGGTTAVLSDHCRIQGGGGAAGLQPPPKRNLKNTNFVDTTISTVLRDLSSSLNQPPKSADE